MMCRNLRLPSRYRWDLSSSGYIKQRVVVSAYRIFGIACLYHLQGSGNPETSVMYYHYTLRNIPKQRRSQEVQ